jgi:hypothetical protein
VIAPAAAGGPVRIDIGNTAEEIPLPQELTPVTVRFPDVAPAVKIAVMDAVFPEGLNPLPV